MLVGPVMGSRDGNCRPHRMYRPARPPDPTAEPPISRPEPVEGPVSSYPGPTAKPPTVHPEPVEGPHPAPLQALTVSPAFPSLNFRRLTNLVQPPHVNGLWYAAQQDGIVASFPDDPSASTASVFLDIRDRVSVQGNEEGLLGLAFDPAYAENGSFFVYYSASNPRRAVLSRFTVVPGNPLRADPASEKVLLEVPQPYSNHNGGQLAFGPDGYLYLGLGDGGAGGDPHSNGQDLGSLLGSLLRIDVSNDPGQPPGYRIPPGNPFAGVPEARPEIWAYGLRNPWRFSFDRKTGDLWLADVGQNRREEINIIRKGRNYGWNIMEGSECFQLGSPCAPAGMEPPLFEYGSGEGCSIIGGYVYRGSRLPSLTGAYVYADYCSGSIWALRQQDGVVTEQLRVATLDRSITSFGQDLQGRLYILTRGSGIYRLSGTASPLTQKPPLGAC